MAIIVTANYTFSKIFRLLSSSVASIILSQMHIYIYIYIYIYVYMQLGINLPSKTLIPPLFLPSPF